MTLYNEIEPYAAEWLRNLSAAGHIAEGRVDERSIADLKPSDIAPDEQFHTFAGIGVWSHALRLAGVPDSLPVWTGSCPCQPFSAAGAGHGFDDPRHLWPEWLRLIRECLPPLIFGEQVASPDGLAWLDLVSSDLENAGYAFAAFDLCAAGFGAPHIRQRLYFCAYRMADADADATRQLIERCRSLRANRDASRGNDAHGRSEASGAVGDTEEGRRGSGRAGETGRDARESDRSGPDRGMADGARVGRSEGRVSEGAQWLDGAGSSDGGRVGNAAMQRSERGEGAGRQARDRSEFGSNASGMGDTGGARSGRHAGSVPSVEGSRGGEGIVDRDLAHLADDAGANGLVGDADESGSQRRGERRHGADLGPARAPGLGNRTAGFWDPCDWIPCRDPKRGIVFRPVEPGTFPLAHGATARVGRLRAYGNAINAPQAAEFIRCALEAIAEAVTP